MSFSRLISEFAPPRLRQAQGEELGKFCAAKLSATVGIRLVFLYGAVTAVCTALRKRHQQLSF
jgi:hypothetical protein